MANIGKVLKDEMIRLSKKNAVSFAKPLKAEIRSLKRQVRSLSIALKSVQASAGKAAPTAASEETPEGAVKAKAFTGKGIKSLRRKFKITQAELAKLAKVSSQAVVMWERKSGKIRLRHATYEAMNAVRGMSKADVKAALGK